MYSITLKNITKKWNKKFRETISSTIFYTEKLIMMRETSEKIGKSTFHVKISV